MQMLTPSNQLTIYFPKLDKKNDCIWYDGLIASYGDALLYAVGDIKIVDAEGEYIYDGQPVGDFDKYCPNGISTDKKLKECIKKHNWEFDANNWFEVTYPSKNKKEIFTYGIEYTYTEAIKLLKQTVKENPYLLNDSPARQCAREIEKTARNDIWYYTENLAEFSRAPCKNREDCEREAKIFGLTDLLTIRKEAVK